MRTYGAEEGRDKAGEEEEEGGGVVPEWERVGERGENGRAGE